MRRLLIVLALVLVPGWAAAQTCYLCYHPPSGGGSGTWDGGAFTDPAEGPTGCTNPTYSFTVDTNAGLCATAANSVLVQTAASGGSRALSIFTDALSGIRFYDAGSAITSFEATDDTATVYTNGVGRFVATNTYVGSLNATFRMYNGATNYSEFTPASTAAGRAVAVPDVAGTVQLNLAAGTAAPGATECDAANEVGRLYHQTGDAASVNLQLFRCTQTGAATYAWQPAGHYAGTTCPATCTASAGPLCYDTDDDLLKSCTADNTWTTVAGGTPTLAQVTAAGATTATLITLDNGATTAGRIAFKEDSDNGSNAVTLIGPASTADVNVTLPAAAGTLLVTPSTITGVTLGGFTADRALVSDGSGNATASSTVTTTELGLLDGKTASGNGAVLVTTTGTQTSGDCVKIDANGNHVANGSACGGGTEYFVIAHTVDGGGQTPGQNKTYCLGKDGIYENCSGRYVMIVPVASTLRAVYWRADIKGTLATTGQTVTHKAAVNESVIGSGVTVDYDSDPSVVSETGMSQAFSAGDVLSFYIITPVTWTQAPTGVRFAVSALFSVP